MNTAQVAFAAAGAVLLAAIVAAFVVILHGARQGYYWTCTLKWAPRPFPKPAAAVTQPGLTVPEPLDRVFAERRTA